MDRRATERTKEYIIVLAVIAGVYLGFKYLSPLVTPFLFAFAFVTLVYPFLEKAQKRFHIKKGFLAAGILMLICITAGVGIWCLLLFVFRQLGKLVGQIDVFEDKFCIFVGNCCEAIERRFGMDGAGVEKFVLERVDIFIENFQVHAVPKMMNESVAYVKDIAGVVGFFVIMIIAAVLLAKDYEQMMEKLHGREELSCMLKIGKKILHHVGTFIRAQIIIMGVISLICAVTLWLTGIEGGIAFGLFTGFMDVLPFIGTGLLLMPLAFWQILNGYYAKAVICVILYVVCAVTREFLEPKLIGNRIGIFPVAVLFSVYAGVKLFGVSGIVKGPLMLITIYEIMLYIREKKGRKEESQA